jgi:hypothetical protein
MVFETHEPLPSFSSLTPARRWFLALLCLAALAGLIWCCVSAYHAQPLPSTRMTDEDAKPGLERFQARVK